MSELEDFDLDLATSQSWDRFTNRLADHLDEMEDDEILVISAEVDEEPDEVSPYFQVLHDDGVFHVEVSSNRYLTGHHRLDAAGQAALVALGLSEDDGTANFGLEVAHDGADPTELASIAVHALRDVFGVFHPAFLRSDQLTSDDEYDEEEPIAVVPQSREHLRALVDNALIPVLGRRPDHDDDGDIAVDDADTVCFVRVQRTVPIVEIFTTVVHQVADLDAATFEVNILNRDASFLRYVVRGDTVAAHLCLPAIPFAPQHLRDTLQYFRHHTALAAPDLAHRVRGRRSLDTEDDG